MKQKLQRLYVKIGAILQAGKNNYRNKTTFSEQVTHP